MLQIHVGIYKEMPERELSFTVILTVNIFFYCKRELSFGHFFVYTNVYLQHFMLLWKLEMHILYNCLFEVGTSLYVGQSQGTSLFSPLGSLSLTENKYFICNAHSTN